jgi:predicted  nucleic acid-binding Zn-ribbon protein
MTDLSQRVLDLQAVDANIARLTSRLKQVETALNDSLTARAGELATRQAEQSLQDKQRRQREIELDLAGVDARLKTNDQKLYSGKGSPRELQALQRDIEHDRARKGEIEERALEAMEATEAATKELARVRAAVARVLQSTSADKRNLAAERDQLRADLDRNQADRARITGGLDAAALSLYDRLRQRLPDGVAAAEVVQGHCQGCRTVLPSAEVQRARTAPGLLQCSVCGRILHVTHG